jgi:hypothetical protein
VDDEVDLRILVKKLLELVEQRRWPYRLGDKQGKTVESYLSCTRYRRGILP